MYRIDSNCIRADKNQLLASPCEKKSAGQKDSIENIRGKRFIKALSKSSVKLHYSGEK